MARQPTVLSSAAASAALVVALVVGDLASSFWAGLLVFLGLAAGLVWSGIVR